MILKAIVERSEDLDVTTGDTVTCALTQHVTVREYMARQERDDVVDVV